MKKLILNPSCSTIVCRIPLYKNGKFTLSNNEDFSTDSYPNSAIDYFISIIKQMKTNGLTKIQSS